MQTKEFISRQTIELKKYIVKQAINIENLELTTGDSVSRYENGTYFGEKDYYYSINGQLSVPVVADNEQLRLKIYSVESEQDNSTNPQMKVFINNQFIQGVDTNHHFVVIPEEFIAEQTLAIRVDIYSGREEKQFPIHLKATIIDRLTYKVFWDFWVALDSWRAVEQDMDLNNLYAKAMKHAALALDFRQPYSELYHESLRAAEAVLQQELYQQEQYKLPVEAYAVGHTHIDIAWLWTVQQAVEKGERSFTTVLKLMEEYPDYRFLQSQPQMYQYIKEQYPDLYQKIKAKIIEGRWQPEGAMWVEADCTLTSGESLVRQFLYGKSFLKEEFAYDSQVVWLPDVFGYSAALPQIMQKTNTPYFMTTKLSWNQYNQIPNDTFVWQGIDGSEVLAHFITTTSEGYSPTPFYTTYNGLLDPYTIRKSWERYGNKEMNDSFLIAYGYGDGGGGPTHEMLETAQRLKDGLPGIPSIKNSNGVDFFTHLSDELVDKKVERWMGELYFEYHRGTYTSIAKNKKKNRQSEFLLQSIEKLFAIINRQAYPQAILERLWKKVLLNQFHDILPGSSIEEVYQDSDHDYAEVMNLGEKLIEELLTDTAVVKEEFDNAMREVYAFNSLGINRDTLLELPFQSEAVITGKQTLKTQMLSEGQMLVLLTDLPAVGAKRLELVGQVEETLAVSEPIKAPLEFETPYYRIRFNEQYEFVSLYDKQAEREVIDKGQTFNQLRVYEDMPLHYDAWDVDIFYQDKVWQVDQVSKATLTEQGPLRYTYEIERDYLDSTIHQTIHFYAHTGRIDFVTKVNWQQQQQLLRAEFPVDVHATKANFDIQFGNIERPVHTNTSWDVARFEVNGQKWIDLSEGDYGVSLLTDSKYGYSVAYKRMGVSLIKSAIDPHPKADIGEHEFTYAIYPHQGTWKQAQTMEEALDLNVPPIIQIGEQGANFSEYPTESWLKVAEKNILLDTIKQAEDSEDIVVRLYEYHQKRTVANLKFKEVPKQVLLCDLLENELETLEVNAEGLVKVPFMPFEIQTLKLKF